MMGRGAMSIGDVAAELHVSVTFLRRLDGLGLVSPARSRGGHRRYSDTQVQLVRRVLVLLAEGFPLATVPRVLALEAELHQLRRERDRVREERDYALRALSTHRAAGRG